LPDVDPDFPLYPLTFRPRLVPKMWGGRRMESELGKTLPPHEPIGESWELYDFPPGAAAESGQGWMSAQVAQGPLAGRTLHELMLAIPHRLLGNVPAVQTPAGPQFPLLVKFLDAAQDLSIQVHPDEAYAAAHPGCHLKNEAWYVIAHEPGARLLRDLRPGTTRESFQQAMAAGTVEQVIGTFPARKGDVHYLPSGTVHALGAGMLVAEVQTPSDTTFRVYDFGRTDPATGRPRELHVEQALEAINFEAPSAGDAAPIATVEAGDGIVAVAPQFTLSKWSAREGMRLPLAAGAPSVLIILEGRGGIVGEDFTEVRFRRGDTLLIPADLTGQQLDPESDCDWLEVTFPGQRRAPGTRTT
jgi:mannose-6-phosphate isomerase